MYKIDINGVLYFIFHFCLQARYGGGDSFLTSTESEMSVDVAQAPEDLWSKRVSNPFES